MHAECILRTMIYLLLFCVCTFYSTFQKDVFNQSGQKQSSRGDELSASSGVSSSAKTQITVIFRAYIEPRHWGRTSENVRVEVRCDLNWDMNNADVKCIE